MWLEALLIPTVTQAYLKQLQENPLRTKMLTSGSLAALQELLASWIAHDRSKHGHYFSARVPKMAIYGAFISAPLGHVLISILQKLFKGRTSLKAKILQILVSNLIVSLGNPPVRSAGRGDVLTERRSIGVADPELRIPRLHGHHRRRKDIPSGQGYSQGGFHASHESQLDHITSRSGVRAEVPARTDVGALFQHCGIRHRDLHQCAHEEEEAGCIEEEGMFAICLGTE